jgi:hypothetical protein
MASRYLSHFHRDQPQATDTHFWGWRVCRAMPTLLLRVLTPPQLVTPRLMCEIFFFADRPSRLARRLRRSSGTTSRKNVRSCKRQVPSAPELVLTYAHTRHSDHTVRTPFEPNSNRFLVEQVGVVDIDEATAISAVSAAELTIKLPGNQYVLHLLALFKLFNFIPKNFPEIPQRPPPPLSLSLSNHTDILSSGIWTGAQFTWPTARANVSTSCPRWSGRVEGRNPTFYTPMLLTSSSRVPNCRPLIRRRAIVFE